MTAGYAIQNPYKWCGKGSTNKWDNCYVGSPTYNLWNIECVGMGDRVIYKTVYDEIGWFIIRRE